MTGTETWSSILQLTNYAIGSNCFIFVDNLVDLSNEYNEFTSELLHTFIRTPSYVQLHRVWLCLVRFYSKQWGIFTIINFFMSLKGSANNFSPCMLRTNFLHLRLCANRFELPVLFVAYSTKLSLFQTISHRMIMNWKWIWFKAPHRHQPGNTEENHATFQLDSL